MEKSGVMNAAVRDLQTLFGMGVMGTLSDEQLLDRFVDRREGAVFEAIVRRHGPMVWGVCRRVLRDHHDAEDAFQATFLVLARKVASIMPRERLGNWLYGVAYQTATKARAMRAKRWAREGQVPDMPEPMAVPDNRRDDLAEALDRELSGLPEKYRTPIILCDLEGWTHQEAASQLGWPIGTVSSRLSRARSMLAKRLTRRGIALSGGSLAVLLAQESASASMPTRLIDSTAQAASLFAEGGAVTAGVVSAEVAALTREVFKVMMLGKLKVATTVLMIGCAVVLGGGGWAYRSRAADPPSQVGQSTTDRPGQEKPTGQPSQPEGGVGSAAGPVGSLAELLSAQARVSQKAYEQALVSRDGKIDVDKVHLWSQRLMQAQIETAVGSYVDDPKARAVYVAAAKAHRDRMRRLEERVRLFVEKGMELPLKHSTAEYYRIEAEGMVLEYDRGSESSNKAK